MAELSMEDAIVLLCARKNLSDDEMQELTDLLRRRPSWGRIYEVALFNKVYPLVSYHLLKFSTHTIPGLVRRQSLMTYLGNARRNEALFKEWARVLAALSNRGIPFSPLKGAHLIPNVYHDMGVRLSNDMDILIPPDAIALAAAVMEDLGYVMGEYDDTTRMIHQITRAKDMFWKRHMGNVHPFIRTDPDPFLDFSCVDFAFDIDPVQKNPDASLQMLGRLRSVDIAGLPVPLLAPDDFLIHVCAHVYKEACSSFAKIAYTLLNLIKFCDVRELVLTEWRTAMPQAWDAFFARVRALHLEAAVRYAFHGVYAVYGDPVFEQLGNQLEVEYVGNPPLPASEAFWAGMFPKGSFAAQSPVDLGRGITVN